MYEERVCREGSVRSPAWLKHLDNIAVEWTEKFHFATVSTCWNNPAIKKQVEQSSHKKQPMNALLVLFSSCWKIGMPFPLQGLMFGYATDETEECMPLTIMLAHKLNAKMAELRRNGVLPWLRPDSKTQVNLRFTPLPAFSVVEPTHVASLAGEPSHWLEWVINKKVIG